MFLEISKTFSRKVFDDGHAAINAHKYKDHQHACSHMIGWQEGKQGIPPYQLPEPFSGRWSIYRLVFVGLNPSLSINEEIPVDTNEWDFERYDNYYRSRFDPDHRNSEGKLIIRLNNGKIRPRPPYHWRWIENFGKKYINGSKPFLLGQHAILIEIVHYKSKNGCLGDDSEKRSLLKHQSSFTGELLDEIAPCVLVPMGNDAVQQLIPLLNLPLEPEPRIRKLVGMKLTGKTPAGGKVLVTPIPHPAAFPTQYEKEAVARAVCQAIKDIRN